MSHYITKALAWYWNLTIVFSSHSTYKPLNGFVVYIRFPRIGLYKLLEIPLLGIGYGIPENVFNNFMEGALIIHISDFIHNPFAYNLKKLGFALFHSINSSYEGFLQTEVYCIFMRGVKIFFFPVNTTGNNTSS